MHLRPLLSVSFVALLAAGGFSSRAADVKFEEQVLVEDVTSANVFISPRGLHAAAIVPKGSRVAVVYDGVEGPKFDSMPSPQLMAFDGVGGKSVPIASAKPPKWSTLGPRLSGSAGAAQILFNPAGTHFAYVGRKGPDYALMLDGKEVHRDAYSQIQFIAFTPDGERLVAIATHKDQGQSRVIIDGQPGPWGVEISEVFATPDGKHIAYLGRQLDTRAQWMVVDGRQVKYIGEIVGFTPQGFLMTRSAAMAGTTLLGNGKPMTLVSSLDVLGISSKTGKLIMQTKPPLGTPPRAKPSVLTVDGNIIPGTEDVTVNGTWFSPDGKRYAILCQRYTNGSEAFVIVDGKKEESYTSIYSNDAFAPSFSPDGTKFVYVAQANTGTFIVVNGEESDGLQSVTLPPTWSLSGSHLAWGGMTTGGKRVFNLDGKMVPLPPNTEPGGSFQFTPDGAHYSWSYGQPGGMTLMVDGKPVPDAQGLGLMGAEPVDGRYAAVKISPDGKHVAYPGRDPKNNARQGVWVDGKFITPFLAPQVNRVVFTPDNQHVFWATSVVKDERGAYKIHVDGREVLTHHTSMLEGARGAWEMADDGTVTFLGRDGDALKRFRIPPPADSSIATMLAAAK